MVNIWRRVCSQWLTAPWWTLLDNTPPLWGIILLIFTWQFIVDTWMIFSKPLQRILITFLWTVKTFFSHLRAPAVRQATLLLWRGQLKVWIIGVGGVYLYQVCAHFAVKQKCFSYWVRSLKRKKPAPSDVSCSVSSTKSRRGTMLQYVHKVLLQVQK